jgi:riboflavin synthase
MFTGLIEALGKVVGTAPMGGGVRVRIATSLAPEVAVADSLAVNGVCLTITAIDHGVISADVGPETLRVTTLGDLATGSAVNLERPLRADARLGGHFVQGHVDAVGRIESWRPEAEFHWLRIAYPVHLAPYLIEKGSIAVDGISLTVAALDEAWFEVQVIPYTAAHTTLRSAAVGGRVNLECDMVGKYVVRAATLAGLIGRGAGNRTGAAS